MVLELLASSVDLSTTATCDGWMAEYGAKPERYGRRRRRPRRASATTPRPATTTPATARRRRRSPSRSKVDNELYVRDYAQVHPLLQVRRGAAASDCAEHVRDRGRRPRLRRAHLHRVRRAAARLGLRLLRQLHRRLPDRRADVQERVRHARAPAPGTSRARPQTDTICPYCGVGCNADAARAGQRDRQGHLAARPRRHAAATCASRAGSASSTSRAAPPKREYKGPDPGYSAVMRSGWV